MIEFCECEYNYECQKYTIVYRLEGQPKPKFIEITRAQMSDPYKMNSIFEGLVMLHKRDRDENL